MHANTQSTGGAAVDTPVPPQVRLGNFLFRYRNAIGPVLFLLALVAAVPSDPWERPDLGRLVAAIGLLFALAGGAFRIFTIGFEYIERGGRNRQVFASKLVQGGVFDHCRNPLYVGNILICIGLALVARSVAFYLLIPIVLFAYSCIVAAEEAYLREKFGGEYAVYCARVARWWPRLSGWSRSLEGMRFNWGRVLVKEYNTILVLVLSLGLLWLWRRYVIGGTEVMPHPAVLAAAFAAWAGVYLFARWLKKSGTVKG
jgi:protein-S-isoprenylcysteine O-methyltransferase Ste14